MIPTSTWTLAQMRLTDFFDVAPDATLARRLLEARASEQSRWVASYPDKTVQPLVWRGEITAEHADDVGHRLLGLSRPRFDRAGTPRRMGGLHGFWCRAAG